MQPVGVRVTIREGDELLLKDVSQRQRAKTQGVSLKVAWQNIPWKKVHRHVFRLQKRMYRATQRGDVHDDRIEVDHINGNHRDARSANLQALHGHCHNAKTREHRDYLPPGLRDKHQDTEERREAKVSCAALEQW